MMQRNDGRESSVRAANGRRVGLFIDFDAIQRSLGKRLDTAELALRLRELAEEQGRLVMAAAYADWIELGDEEREFRAQRIETRLVCRETPGDDSPAVVLSLDACETLFVGPAFDLFVIATGDSGNASLLHRLRRADREVILVAHGAAVSGPPFHGSERFLTIDELCSGPRPARTGQPSTLHVVPQPVPAPGVVPARKTDFSQWDWEPFIRLTDELEANMPFVGFGWLLKKKLNPENSGCYTLQDKQDLMDHAVEEGLLTLYKVENIEEGGDPVTACKLNRDHARVREVLG